MRFGYRINHNRYMDCVRSVFAVHNETANIWSHIIGGLIFLALVPYALIYLKPTTLHDSQSLL